MIKATYAIFFIFLLTLYPAAADDAARGGPAVIMKSQTAPSFAADVEAYAREFSAWKSHMAKVSADAAASVPKDRAHAPFPAPAAPDAVMRAVEKETGKPNYSIVDDGPTAEQVLANKKAALVEEVAKAEDLEVGKVLPAAKARAWQFRVSDVIRFDAAELKKAMAAADAARVRMTEISQQRDLLSLKVAIAGSGVIGSIVQAISGPKPEDVAAAAALDGQLADQRKVVEEAERAYQDFDGLKARTRSPEDHAFMLDYEARAKVVESIHRWAARQMSDVSDLTIESVDSWKITPFSN